MPPRRNPQRPVRDMVVEDLQREVQRLHQELARRDQRDADRRQEEEEDLNPFHNEVSSEDEDRRRRPLRDRTVHRGDVGIKIDLPDFDGKLDPDEFVN
ncbi:hypothetical protein MA16_Dca023876 [Dendrobium catenatum]|uniref:Uncharacterized protein n=1 Tax=Dendrobium catenatum TaxID=906689 RepID=A0A2I0XFM4_9ASPA|nr:hypothetical protein MA16_Dca023876 [Dendrobium catenatum]